MQESREENAGRTEEVRSRRERQVQLKQEREQLKWVDQQKRLEKKRSCLVIHIVFICVGVGTSKDESDRETYEDGGETVEDQGGKVAFVRVSEDR